MKTNVITQELFSNTKNENNVSPFGNIEVAKYRQNT
jgi:hypothetical protein